MTSLMSACYPSWAEFFEPGDLLEDFEEIENVFNITSKLVKDHSDELLSVICLEIHHLRGPDQYCLMIKRSSGRRQKYVSMLIPCYVLDR